MHPLIKLSVLVLLLLLFAAVFLLTPRHPVADPRLLPEHGPSLDGVASTRAQHLPAVITVLDPLDKPLSSVVGTATDALTGYQQRFATDAQGSATITLHPAPAHLRFEFSHSHWGAGTREVMVGSGERVCLRYEPAAMLQVDIHYARGSSRAFAVQVLSDSGSPVITTSELTMISSVLDVCSLSAMLPGRYTIRCIGDGMEASASVRLESNSSTEVVSIDWGGASVRPPVTVSGIITRDEKPLSMARVLWKVSPPASFGRNFFSQGSVTTDSTGRYQIETSFACIDVTSVTFEIADAQPVILDLSCVSQGSRCDVHFMSRPLTRKRLVDSGGTAVAYATCKIDDSRVKHRADSGGYVSIPSGAFSIHAQVPALWFSAGRGPIEASLPNVWISGVVGEPDDSDVILESERGLELIFEDNQAHFIHFLGAPTAEAQYSYYVSRHPVCYLSNRSGISRVLVLAGSVAENGRITYCVDVDLEEARVVFEEPLEWLFIRLTDANGAAVPQARLQALAIRDCIVADPQVDQALCDLLWKPSEAPGTYVYAAIEGLRANIVTPRGLGELSIPSDSGRAADAIQVDSRNCLCGRMVGPRGERFPEQAMGRVRLRLMSQTGTAVEGVILPGGDFCLAGTGAGWGAMEAFLLVTGFQEIALGVVGASESFSAIVIPQGAWERVHELLEAAPVHWGG